jgi:ubiquitin C-terminal hydrolase
MNAEYSSKKRKAEDIELNENGKLPKFEPENNHQNDIENVNIILTQAKNDSSSTSSEEKLTEINNTIYTSSKREIYSDIIVKTEIPRSMLEGDINILTELTNRENQNYLYEMRIILHEGSFSGTLVCFFVNGDSEIKKSYNEEIKDIISNIDEHFEESGKEKGINSNNNEKEDVDVSDKITFDLQFTVNIINFKNVNFIFKDVEYGKMLKFAIPLNTSFFRSNDNPIIVTEIAERKNYNTEVGFTGIINEAMTCYMNSMLQMLNCLGYFKKALFKIPVSNHEDVSYNLQRFFYNLSNSKYPISTNKLVKSFGWSREQIFEQHDVQEFNMLLSDVMEKKMKDTESEGTFKFLFEGKLYSYIKCIDVDYESSREETFSDLQLTVRGVKDINESLAKYTEEELLDGEDKYDSEKFGKQTAKIGKKFISFPNVLIAQLKRFEYNPRKDSMDKINDYFEFSNEIDVKNYMKDIDNDNEEFYKFTLHAVVVHRGNINNGHYFAYIRPNVEDKWYQFNDEKVREADKFEVFNLNFGGPNKLYKHKEKGQILEYFSKLEANAYILIYIRNTVREKILSKVIDSDIPDELKALMEQDKEKERKIEMERIRKIRNMNVYIVTKETFRQYHDLGLTPPVLNIWNDDSFLVNDKYRLKLNIPKSTTIRQLLEYVTHYTNIPIANLVIYLYVLDKPFKILQRNEFNLFELGKLMYDKTINEVQQLDSMGSFKSLILFIDILHDTNLQILELNSNLNEDGETVENINNENGEEMMFYQENGQYFRFKQNIYQGTTFYREQDIFFHVVVFKYIDEHNNNRLTIDDVKLINNNKTQDLDLNRLIPFDDRFKKYSSGKLIKVNIYIEKTSFNLNEYLANYKENNGLRPDVEMESQIEEYNRLIKIKDLNVLKEYFLYSSSYCLIINIEFEKANETCSMEKITDILYNHIYLRLNYVDNLVGNDLQIEIGERYLFSLADSEENIMERILQYAKDYTGFNDLFETPYKLYFLNPEENYLKTLEQFINELDSDQVSVLKYNARNSEYIEDMPIYKYIQMSNREPELAFKFTLKNLNTYDDYSNSDDSEDRIPLNISFFDINNNPMCRLITYINRRTINDTVCARVINNIYDTAIKKLYDDSLPPEDYYFVLQHPNTFFAYEIFTRRSENLLKYCTHNLSIEYRLQPFSFEEIETFNDDQYSKVFVAFCTRDFKPACDPIVIHVNRDSKVIEAKNYIFEKIQKIEKVKRFDFTFQKLKFYTYALIDYKPYKEILLLNTKDEEGLFTFCKHNLLVEFPSDLPTSNAIIIL